MTTTLKYPLYLFNTLTKQKEQIKTHNLNKMAFYVCGPTVYDFVHLGNARSFVFYDLLFRVFKALYNEVIYIRNITDIDDKIITKAQKEGVSELAISQKYTNAFHEACNFLNCLQPTHEPKVSDNINEIVDIINNLLKRGHAYYAGNDIYFSVESFKDYGKLSGRNIEDMLAGARLEIDINKKHPADFVLWKGKPKTTTTNSSEISFEATFYTPQQITLNGRPGWHIECSAMSKKHLGDNFDIHGGGIDLQFPHHENEIAQSVCAFDGCSYAKYWVHNGFLMINGAKMSKSDGNFITIQDLINKGYHGEVVRLAILSTHYTKPLDFSDSLLSQTKKILDKFYQITQEYNSNFFAKYANASQQDLFLMLPDLAKDAIVDDINIAKYIAIMHTLYNDIKNTTNDPKGKQQSACSLLAMGYFIGIMKDLEYFTKLSNDINLDSNYTNAMQFAKERAEYKKLKDFKKADDLRNKVLELGFKIVDLANGDFNLESK